MNFIRSVVRLDLRALAAFRLLLSAIVISFVAGIAGNHGWSPILFIDLFASLVLLLGFRTRIFVIIVWLSTLAVIVDADLLTDVTSRILMALLFLSSFLPLGARYSLDSSMNSEVENTPLYLAPPSIAFTLQVFLILGTQIVSALHLGAEIENGIYIGIPTIALLAGLVAILPGFLMDALSLAAQSVHKNGLRIYYDQDCGFCYKICLIFRTFFLLGNTPITPAQDDSAANAVMEKYDTWVVYDHDGRCFIRWHAVLLLMRRSLLFRPLGLVLTAIQMGRWCDWLYSAIASNRRHWSTATSILLPYRKVNIETGPATLISIGVWLASILLFNFFEPIRLLMTAMPGADIVVTGFAFDQNWCSTLNSCLDF